MSLISLTLHGLNLLELALNREYLLYKGKYHSTLDWFRFKQANLLVILMQQNQSSTK